MVPSTNRKTARYDDDVMTRTNFWLVIGTYYAKQSLNDFKIISSSNGMSYIAFESAKVVKMEHGGLPISN